ncbi:Hsp20 family protein [Planococcus halocryophilus]|uniref:SHSP domain-containing protein n=1 Tax=Planococcus halocryophilus TaxID=1215089 RepID=A0A1C7DPI8_9BACL|nr:Hsp20 family protein [Planococcus halocryophilus]ANU13314.1 hypothetical protein BBI08_05445 [Planococcus halocryophilus]
MRKFLSSKRDDFMPSLFKSRFETDLFAPFFLGIHYPKVAIREGESRHQLKVYVPGFSKKEINVEFRDGYLELESAYEEKKQTKENEDHYICKEKFYGSFKRSFYVGEIDENKISGSFKRGMLKRLRCLVNVFSKIRIKRSSIRKKNDIFE